MHERCHWVGKGWVYAMGQEWHAEGQCRLRKVPGVVQGVEALQIKKSEWIVGMYKRCCAVKQGTQDVAESKKNVRRLQVCERGAAPVRDSVQGSGMGQEVCLRLLGRSQEAPCKSGTTRMEQYGLRKGAQVVLHRSRKAHSKGAGWGWRIGMHKRCHIGEERYMANGTVRKG